ncbi:formylglycine-generating enzyme family protein [Azospirillum isscasi]|uniref:Formylglycine-generating enzyme family protein n=1 Tax=Azospirillum isscasi TaxID=3053926 RepID=A0ABU0WS53_9PROT|nr:formylglycine-generating enzyme family protein [Azospirillum isscasi]MDQ2106384.1 formylglycine-generating enzyme family protein [Azospirillum isscasi]
MKLYQTVWRAVAVAALCGALLSPSAARADDRGMLRIVTEPGDAQIFIDGKRRGSSPAEAGQSFAVKLEEGIHVVEARKTEGSSFEYYVRRDDVFVADGTMQTLTLKLARKFIGKGFEPEMVAVPAGSFRMGCMDNREGCPDALPVRLVNVFAFEIGKYEVTFDQWDACVADGGCTHMPGDEGWGRGNRPVINVSWNDIQSYLAWLNRKTGKRYRLPSEAEWEYAARAGTGTSYWWGNAVGSNNANCYNCGSRWDNKQTAPVGSFKPNHFGLYDVHGNVGELVADCWHGSYKGAPSDSSAWTTGKCEDRITRGGSWFRYPWNFASAYRVYISPDFRVNDVGFRVARTITP